MCVIKWPLQQFIITVYLGTKYYIINIDECFFLSLCFELIPFMGLASLVFVSIGV